MRLRARKSRSCIARVGPGSGVVVRVLGMVLLAVAAGLLLGFAGAFLRPRTRADYGFTYEPGVK